MKHFAEESVLKQVWSCIHSAFLLFPFADCIPEKAFQVLAETREHGGEVLHHGKLALGWQQVLGPVFGSAVLIQKRR